MIKQWFILFYLAVITITISCHSISQNDISYPAKHYKLINNWVFYADTSPQVSYPATVPGTVHTDLLNAGKIEDPFVGNNEMTLRNLEQVNWVYENVFTLSKKQLTSKNITLVFEGLDTYADIYLNGKRLGSAQNMFRTWTFNIAHLVQIENKLEIRFTPPSIYNRANAHDLGYTLPADNENSEIKVSPFTRKAPYHFGWDWGPRIVTSGIWKPVYLDFWKGAQINEASINTVMLDQTTSTAEMLATIHLTSDAVLKDVEVVVGDHKTRCSLTKGENELHVPFVIPEPKLWWPNGSGDAFLYEKTISVHHDGVVLDKRNVKFGIRTIELINEKDSIGTAFYFKVNGRPVFAQGANYIPQDVFLPRVKNSQYRTLLSAAKDAHMNMVRVWGGGVYEKDIFYQLCDSLGLMVWQDFMFAGTMYPGDSAFVEDVKIEVREQSRRLKKHPSLALFCGNNELEVAWFNWGWQTKYGYTNRDSIEIWSNYLKLFHNLIPKIVEEESPNTEYTPTSPLSNWGTPENFNHSSMHYWGVWHGRDSFGSFKHNVGRFMVEYGMQSYPEMTTIQKFATPKDWHLESDIMKNRQKSYIGNAEILKHIRMHFDEPETFKDFVSLSQQSQAKALEIAIRAHKNSNGHCMGTLLWQLNDCWPGPSWSIIDYYGKKKKAFDIVKQEYGRKSRN